MVLTRSPRRGDEMSRPVTTVLVLVGFMLLAHGGEHLYHALGNRQPHTLTCEQLAQGPPGALWLRVTGCTVDEGAGYRESRGRLNELYLLMRSPSQPPAAPVSLVVVTSDSRALAAAEATIGNAQQPDQEAYGEMMRRIVTSLNASREVEGYVRSGAIEKFQTRRALAGLSARLAPDFVALDLHGKPTVFRPAIEVGLGLALLAVAFFRRSRRAPHVAVEGDPAVLDAPADSGVAPHSPRIPPVMLLNLAPTSGPADLEAAPPLGSRNDVLQRIKAILGHIGAAPDGRVNLQGPNWALTLDVGREDPVWTVTVDARGDESADVLARLVRETGWRIFMPKLGKFVDSSALSAVSSRPSERS
jgi:hypothetical protein